MPYITVRYTPPNVAGSEAEWFAGTSKTYIDRAYANWSSSDLEAALISRSLLGVKVDHSPPSSGTRTYSTVKSPHEVLDFLEGIGYRVVATVTIDQRTVVWTLHKQQ